LAKQGIIEKAIEHTSYIIDEFYNIGTLREISNAIDNVDILYMALDKIKKTKDDSTTFREKGEELKLIAIEFHKRGLYHIYLPLINDSLNLLSLLSYNWSDKGGILEEMAIELAAIGELKDAYKVIGKLRYLSEKESALKNISNQEAVLGNFRNCSVVLLKLLSINKELGEKEIDTLSIDISIYLSRRNFTDNAIILAKSISNDWDNAYALWQIALECISQDKFEIGFEIALNIEDRNHIGQACEEIAKELIKRDYIIEALNILQRLADSIDYCQSSILIELSCQLFSQNKIEDASLLIEKAINCIPCVCEVYEKSQKYLSIYTELIKQGKEEQAESIMQEALVFIQNIADYDEKSRSMQHFATEMVKQGKIVSSIEYARGITDDFFKCAALEAISSELREQGNIEEASIVLEEALDSAWIIKKEKSKFLALKDISVELAKQGNIEKALECARTISNDSHKSSSLKSISRELAKQGKIEEALECAHGIIDDYRKNRALKEISTELINQGKLEEALECARSITDESDKGSALHNISFELAKQGNWPLAEKTGIEISKVYARFECWKRIAGLVTEQDGWLKALQNVSNFKNQDVHEYYLKGLTKIIKTSDFDKTLLTYARGYYQNDIVSIETLLQHHALHELFFSNAASEKIERFNRTLNIQWAIDIKNQFT
jgi:tetratricopeptide (TPR) repeat protein